MGSGCQWVQGFVWGVENVLKLMMVVVAKLCEYALKKNLNSTLKMCELSVSGFYLNEAVIKKKKESH